jgi:tyrosine-protein kinase Etk/Wzc
MVHPHEGRDSMVAAERGLSAVELVSLLRRNLRFIVTCGTACFVLVVAITLVSGMKFHSAGRLYLGELDAKVRPSGAAGDFDLSGIEASDLGSELEILRSRSLVTEAILASGLNTTLSPAGFQRPRYWKWRLSRRAVSALEPAAAELRAVATRLTDESGGVLQLRLHVLDRTRYEVWNDTRRLGTGKLGEALQLSALTLTLVAGESHGPAAGRWYDLEVSPLDDVIQEVGKTLQVSVPKPLVQSESSKVVTLEFVHPSPRLAASFLRELMHEYLEQRRAWKTEDASAAEAFVTEQLESMRKSLQEAERKLADYRSATRVVVLDNEAKAMIEQVGKYEEQRVAARLEVAALSDIKRALSNPALPLEAYLFGEASDSVLQNLATTLSKERLELTELEQRFHEAAPDVKEKRAQVEAHLGMIRSYVANRLSRAQESLGAMNEVIAQFEDKLKTVPGAELGLLQLSRESEVYSRMYSYLLERQQQAAIVKASTVSKNRVLDAPEVPYREHAPNLPLRLLAALFGFVIGTAWVVLRRLLASTLQSDGEVRAAAGGLPILASIPGAASVQRKRGRSQLEGLAADPTGAFAEAFRTLRTNLYLTRARRAGNVVLVTSPGAGDGKTTCVLSVAAMLAADQKKVLVVDADLRTAALHELAGLPADAGLRGVLSGACGVADVLHDVELASGGFQLLGAGPRGPAELLSSQRMQELLAELGASYDFVLLDSPSFPQFSDALILASLVHGVLSVLRFQHTPRKRAAEHVRRIASVSAFHGIVVNGAAPGEAEAPTERGTRKQPDALHVARATGEGSY